MLFRSEMSKRLAARKSEIDTSYIKQQTELEEQRSKLLEKSDSVSLSGRIVQRHYIS